MKIDLADILVALGALAMLAGIAHFNLWAALVLFGLFLVIFGTVLGRATAKKAKGQ